MTLLAYLQALPDRCDHGYAEVQHPQLCNCAEFGEWSIFARALRSVVRSDGTVHVNDVRPLVRGRIAPKHVGSLYRRAKSLGLLVDVDRWEPSTDHEGANVDKPARVYDAGPTLRSAA
jgi:hypothetical protein